jgi:hypothetical protein
VQDEGRIYNYILPSNKEEQKQRIVVGAYVLAGNHGMRNQNSSI